MISFLGVNAHHQNGIVEKRIRDLQDTSRTMLVYVKKCWPKAVSSHLWPYALQTANNIFIFIYKQGFRTILSVGTLL